MALKDSVSKITLRKEYPYQCKIDLDKKKK